MKPLFDGIDRLEFVGANTKKDYRGIRGLYKLSRELAARQDFQAVADLHNVLRTKILRFFIRVKNKAVIDKGRAEKKELTRTVNKKLRPLKSGFRRYADVFEKIGYSVELDVPGGIKHLTADPALIPGQPSSVKLIGIAPFARHLPKMYPLEKMKEVVEQLSKNFKVILFGSPAEASVLDQWTGDNVYSVAGKIKFAQELNLISQLDAMISMDSANMHLASLHGVPVVSIWGGTHPYLGFYGWGQLMENAVQLDLPCRPSSVFGKKPCPVHGEQGCMSGIEPSMITDRLGKIIPY